MDVVEPFVENTKMWASETCLNLQQDVFDILENEEFVFVFGIVAIKMALQPDLF